MKNKMVRFRRFRAGDGAVAVMLGVSLCGFLIFYVAPFLLSAVYAFVDNPIQREFVGLKNFIALFSNEYFLLGLKNTGIFLACGIPAGVVLSLALALLLHKMTRGSEWVGLIFLIPLVLPSALMAFVWENLIAEESYGMWLMVLIFLSKNIGYNMVLYLNGLSRIPPEFYECACAEGAGAWWRFVHVTLPYLTPTSFLVLIMSLVNSFKIFKEIYLMTGAYPPEPMYLLQHFMNSTLASLNYPKLVSAVYVLTGGLLCLILILYRAERAVSAKLSGE